MCSSFNKFTKSNFASQNYARRRNRQTHTGYQNNNLYNSLPVRQPKPLTRTFKVPVEFRTPITVSARATNEYMYTINGTTMSTTEVVTYDLKAQTKATIWNQIKSYAGMIKGLYLSNMIIELIPLMTKDLTQGAHFYIKVNYNTTENTDTMQYLEPIALIAAGQHRQILPSIPSLNRQLIAAPGLSSVDFANKWTTFPDDPSDLDLSVPLIHVYQPYPFLATSTTAVEGMPAFIMNVKFFINLAPNDTLNELVEPTFMQRAWRGVKKIASNGVVQAVGKAAINTLLNN